MSLHSLPIFLRLVGRPVILIGEGEAADAKRRLLERAGAVIVAETDEAAIAIVALPDEEEALAAVTRLRARGVLVNAVDRVELCDFTLPAIVDRDPVLIAVGTGGASAGLAAALRQRLEAMLPVSLRALANGLHAARIRLRARFPDADERRRALATALDSGGALDPLGNPDLETWLAGDADAERSETVMVRLASPDPDDLTLRHARLLANADRIHHTVAVPRAILDRARADAVRIVSDRPPVEPGSGLTLFLEMA